MIKLSQTQYPIQEYVFELSKLKRGDIIQIFKFEGNQLQQDQRLEIEVNPMRARYRIMVFDHYSGNTIYGWFGNAYPSSTPRKDVRNWQIYSAIDKYMTYLEASRPAMRTYILDPQLDRMLYIGNSDIVIQQEREEQRKRDEILVVEPWYGLGKNANIWYMVEKSSNPTVTTAINQIDKNGRIVNYELRFQYIRKLKRHYPKKNTYTSRVVRPHFIYKIVSKNAAISRNEYLLTRDYYTAMGEWRTFIVYDSEFGMQRLFNAKKLHAFIFDVNEAISQVKEGMSNINQNIIENSIDYKDYKYKKREHDLYNSLKSYYKHLKKLKKKSEKESSIKFDRNYLEQGVFDKKCLVTLSSAKNVEKL